MSENLNPITNAIMEIVQLDDSVLENMNMEKFFTSIEKDFLDKTREDFRNFKKELLERKCSTEDLIKERNSVQESLEEIVQTIDPIDTTGKKVQILRYIYNFILEAYNGVIETWNKIGVKIELSHPNAKLPTYAHYNDAGCDVYAVEDTIIDPNSTAIINTGLKVAIPDGWLISIRPRSGLSAKTKLRVANAPGTIDSGYHSVIGIILTNLGTEPVEIHAGDRIAQMVIEKSYQIIWEPVDSVDNIDNNNRAAESGADGFGSTGT